MATSQDFVNWVCGPEMVPRFLAAALMAARRFIRSLASGAVHNTVYVPTVEAFEICAPTVSIQEELVSRLESQQRCLQAARRAADAEAAAIEGLTGTLLRQVFNPGL